MARYGMVIDLKKCVGCNACVVACKAEHNSPNDIMHTQVLEKEIGEFPQSNRLFVPVLCNHCENPICCEVCPSEATYQRDDGVVVIDYKKCIGCCACIENCPYRVRELVRDNRTLFPDGKTIFEKPVHQRIPNNVVTKCDFCYHRIEQKTKPACCEACPAEARIFGDLNDESSEICTAIRKYKGWQMLPESGTRPCVYYIG